MPVVLPLTAIRPISNANPVIAADLPRFTLTKGLISRSAAQFPEIALAARQLGYDLETIELPDLQKVILESAYSWKYLSMRQENSDALLTVTSPKIVRSEIAPEGGAKYWDAVTIVNMVATGVIDVQDPTFVERYGVTLETVGFDEQYADALGSVYSNLPRLSQARPPDATDRFQNLKEDVEQYDPLQQSLLMQIGSITLSDRVYGGRDGSRSAGKH
jgi:hypothetical protein